jgi:hypothetical protein
MRDPESFRRRFAEERKTDPQAPSPVHGGVQLRDTQAVSAAPLISVLADIIMATCVSMEPIASREMGGSDDMLSLER